MYYSNHRSNISNTILLYLVLPPFPKLKTIYVPKNKIFYVLFVFHKEEFCTFFLSFLKLNQLIYNYFYNDLFKCKFLGKDNFTFLQT